MVRRDLIEQRPAREVRHRQIEHHGAHRLLPKQCRQRPHVVQREHLRKPRGTQRDADAVQQLRLIVNEQDRKGGYRFHEAAADRVTPRLSGSGKRSVAHVPRPG
jgi:hypothetical protein